MLTVLPWDVSRFRYHPKRTSRIEGNISGQRRFLMQRNNVSLAMLKLVPILRVKVSDARSNSYRGTSHAPQFIDRRRNSLPRQHPPVRRGEGSSTGQGN